MHAECNFDNLGCSSSEYVGKRHRSTRKVSELFAGPDTYRSATDGSSHPAKNYLQNHLRRCRVAQEAIRGNLIVRRVSQPGV